MSLTMDLGNLAAAMLARAESDEPVSPDFLKALAMRVEAARDRCAPMESLVHRHALVMARSVADAGDRVVPIRDDH